VEPPQMLSFDSNSTKYGDLVAFVSKYVRSSVKEETTESQEAKEEQVSEKETLYGELKAENFSHVSSSNAAHLVYLTSLKESEEVTSEWKHIKKLARTLRGAIPLWVVRVDKTKPAEENVFKKSFAKPELRLYPANYKA